jgi:uncharacterized tellurite resistance protein B-like protein
MRHYPPNSPPAAARVLAMALLADGHYSMVEVQALDRLHAPRRLGLTPEAFKQVLDDFCQDLLTAHQGQWTGSFHRLDPVLRSQLVGEVTDPALQREVQVLCTDIVKADGHLAEGEIQMMDALAGLWSGRAAPAVSTTTLTERTS